MREHIRWVHAANKAEYPEPAPYSCVLCTSNTILMDREELCTHIVKHSDQIAAIIKQSTKATGDSEETNTESESPTTEQPANGMKCDQKVIKRNKKLLSKLLNGQKTSEVTHTKTINHGTDSRMKQKMSNMKVSDSLQDTEYKCELCKVNCNVKEIFCDHILMQIIG